MKQNLKSSRLLKTFEIGKNKMEAVTGGTQNYYTTDYWIRGDAACSQDCPDSTIDYQDGTPVK